MRPVILTCAITGSIHTPSMSPHLPVTPADIADQAIAAAEAGAAILHLHARDPETGRPSARVEDFMAFLPRIAAATDAIVNLSTGGSAIMSLEERLQGPTRAEPEMCSLNMGTMNFALYPMADPHADWLHDWELPFLQNSDDLVFKNTPRDIASVLERMSAVGARFEYECYDVGHLYMLRHFFDRGLARAPLFIQFVFGVLGGIGGHPSDLVHMKATADRLFGSDYQFSVLAAGRRQKPMALQAAAMGGHVRVGLEDNLYRSRGVLSSSNAEQVSDMAALLAGLDLRPATTTETREMLNLKGVRATRLAS